MAVTWRNLPVTLYFECGKYMDVPIACEFSVISQTGVVAPRSNQPDAIIEEDPSLVTPEKSICQHFAHGDLVS